MKKKQNKTLRFNKDKNKVICVTEEEAEFDIEGDVDEIRRIYKERLKSIIQEVKSLKGEAEEIKEILGKLK